MGRPPRPDDLLLPLPPPMPPRAVATLLGYRGEGMKYEVRMHIALTRATAGVIVVCDEEDLGRDPRLAMAAAKA